MAFSADPATRVSQQLHRSTPLAQDIARNAQGLARPNAKAPHGFAAVQRDTERGGE